MAGSQSIHSSRQQTVTGHIIRPTNPFIPFEREEIEQSISQRFEEQVRTYPDRIAIKTKHHELKYKALNTVANRTARAIRLLGINGQNQIALLLDHDAPMLAAIMGVLKAGKIYVPMDPRYPSARVGYMLEDSQAALIVTNDTNLSLAKELAQGTLPLLNIDELETGLSTENLDLHISPDSVAYILYTSGSTGKPKGVPQCHRNVLHEVMNYTNAAHICRDDRMLLISSFSFADSVRTIFGALLNGASLFPLNVKEEGLTALADWLIQQEITMYRSVPTAFRHFTGSLSREVMFPNIRLVYLAGEPVYGRDLELYRNHFSSDCILVNGLGCSETLTYRWHFFDKKTQIKGNDVPVGYAIDDMEVLLIGENGEEVEANNIGEIAVKSRFLSPGYWRQPDLTQNKFKPSPKEGDERTFLTGDLGRMMPDGCLVHMGRKDFQVKIRGYRVEVAEIEMLLVRLDDIKDAVVVSQEDRTGDRSLVAYLVPAGHHVPATGELRRFLAGKLPDYMIPSAFVTLETLPLLPNGKVDRHALPAPSREHFTRGASFKPPRSSTEEILAKIWAEVLGLDQVGIHDNFYELGGHSLLATRIVLRIHEILQMEVTLRSVFEAPTVAQLASVIEEMKSRNIRPSVSRIVPVSREACQRRRSPTERC